jgi:hypothetical protein
VEEAQRGGVVGKGSHISSLRHQNCTPLSVSRKWAANVEGQKGFGVADPRLSEALSGEEVADYLD